MSGHLNVLRCSATAARDVGAQPWCHQPQLLQRSRFPTWSFRAPIDPSMLTSSQAAEIVPSNWSCWLLSMATCTWGQPSIFWIGAAASLVTAAKNRSASSRHSKQWEQIRRKDKHVFVLGGSQGKSNSGKHFEICSGVWSWRCWMGNMWSYKTTAFHRKSLELAGFLSA